APAPPSGPRYAQGVRLRDDADPVHDHWPPDWDAIARAVAANPGALWLIGNEPDVVSQDNCLPQEYADRYHDVHTFIRERDTTARIAAAGIVQPTALRLRWLDAALAAYQATYGRPMPVDAWHIHVQILPEVASWGCYRPPGFDGEPGENHQVNDNASVTLFADKIRQFRAWMRDRGQRDKPLIISEYGVLMPSGCGFLGGLDVAVGDQMVKDFMRGTFDFCLTATDPALGYPGDGNRLVQEWAWYSLNNLMWDSTCKWLEGAYNGALFDWRRNYPGTLTQFGAHLRDYLAEVP
ncbi:MAG: hypothetical protein V1772_01345, partial [Chloroflexota bacterium]